MQAQPSIRDVTARLLPTRLKHGLVISGHTIGGERQLPVVRVQTDRSAGFGEAPPLPTFTGQGALETLQEVESVAATLVGMSVPDALRRLHSTDVLLGSQARCALDVALHDASARAQRVPLSALLGPRRQTSVRISRAIGFHDLETTLRLATEYRRLGMQALKIKVGRGVQTDAATVNAVRDVAGPEVELAIDANGAYEPSDAIALVRACRGADLAFFEQPVERHDLAGMRAVREAGINVMADESVFDADDVHRLVRAEAADLIAIKLIKCGGLIPALAMAHAAQEHHLQVIVIDPLGSAVSLNAGLALATTLADHGYAHGLSAGMDVTATYAPHLALEQGVLHASDDPGLGVRVRWDLEGATA